MPVEERDTFSSSREVSLMEILQLEDVCMYVTVPLADCSLSCSCARDGLYTLLFKSRVLKLDPLAKYSTVWKLLARFRFLLCI